MLLTQRDLAAKLGVSEQTIWKWRKMGMPFKKIPGFRQNYFTVEDVLKWMDDEGKREMEKNE